jgi:hypothetical protein
MAICVPKVTTALQALASPDLVHRDSIVTNKSFLNQLEIAQQDITVVVLLSKVHLSMLLLMEELFALLGFIVLLAQEHHYPVHQVHLILLKAVHH